MNYSFKLKKALAKTMAEVDSKCMGVDESQAFEYHLTSDPFELLHYWIEYFGVFDGGEDMLELLKPSNL